MSHNRNRGNKDFFLRIFFFAKTAFLNPRAIGAFVPSSHFLAERMADCIDQTQSGLILELGPGTGVVTRAILNTGIPAEKLIAVELSSAFIENFRDEFPDVTIIPGNAVHLTELMKNQQPVQTIISSLPLRNFSNENRDAILSAISAVLTPNGKYIQFSYSIKDNHEYYPPNMTLIDSFIVWRNLPPARVNVFQNKSG